MNDSPIPEELRVVSGTLPVDAEYYELALLRSIIRRNIVRQVIPLFLTCTSVAIVFMLREMFQWTLHMKVAWFSIITLGVLVALCIWAFARLHWLNVFLKCVARELPPERFSIFHARIVSAGPQSGRATVLEQMTEACRTVARFDGGPSFAKLWFARLTKALDAASRDPDNALRVLEAGAKDLPPDPGWRSFAQFCLTGLLFIGIIGTFLGLLGVFTPATFTPLFDAMRTPERDFTKSLGGLLADFGLAFGASLVAYLAYLFGRFTADLVDEAHDETTSFLTAELLGGVRLVLTPLQIEMRVDLSPETKALLEERVIGMQALTEQGLTQMRELRSLNARFGELAVLFRQATMNALKATQTILVGLQEGRKE